MDKGENLLLLVAVSGELQADMGEYIVGSRTYAAALITKLKKEGCLAVRSQGGVKGYVLRAKGKKAVKTHAPEIAALYLQGAAETNHIKSDLTSRLRLHRMSMAWAFCFRMGIRIFPTQKPAFPPPLEKGEESVVYYGAAEVKNGSDKVKGSRACGLFACCGQVFVVYHTMDRRMKWAKKMERSMRQFVENRFLRQGSFVLADAVMVGSDMETMIRLLESDGGCRGNLFQVDDTYEHWYYFPMQSESRVQLELVLNRERGSLFYAFLCQSLARTKEQEYALFDGYDERGTPVYFCYELELCRLMRIKQEMGFGRKGKIICMDFQAEALREYFGKEVEMAVILPEKVMEYISGRQGTFAP